MVSPDYTGRSMRKTVLLLLLFSLPLLAQKRAKNVILLLGDAGGVATLNAASILGHGEPQKLYIQSMPYIGLSDTSTDSQWVSDSAAGMTAVVTGVKTQNGVISEGPETVRGKTDGKPLKTILEYAEEHGLSTGVITNMPVVDATPAACYSHANDRKAFSTIFQQLFKPRFGDGVDVLIGPGRGDIEKALKADGLEMTALAQQAGRMMYPSVSAIPADAHQAIAIFDKRDDFSLPEAVDRAVKMLSANKKGYFLMIEGDMHTSGKVEPGLRRALELDDIIRKLSKTVSKDTLILFTADHSFDLRMHGGLKGKPLLTAEDKPEGKGYRGGAVRMDDTHTGEEVIVAAQGPGASAVHGYMPNTKIFHIMMSALGWKEN
ncbi:MAG: alkaline phosphatase [Acidobacteria bacterium]|nr:alkaline phosphatase [Acidobacteriota bacterium]